MIVDMEAVQRRWPSISLGGVVASRSIRIAATEMDEEIVSQMPAAAGLAIGERMAEEIKMTVGSASDAQWRRCGRAR